MAASTSDILMRAGLSKSMAYHVASGKRNISVPLALWLHERDGLKVGPLDGKSAAEIRALRSVHSPQAPESVLRRRAANTSPQEAA